MKKILAIGMAAALSLTLLAGCGGNNNNNNNNNKDENNEAPVITGVPVEAQGMVGEEYDALAGVTATDAEDGDLTDQIQVSAEGLVFEGGKTTPAEASPLGYEIAYTVTDSDGETTTEFCTFKVKEGAGELTNVYTADFSDITPKYDWAEGNEGEGNNHWWSLTANDGAEAAATLKEGKLAVNVTNRNNVGDDKLMLTRGFDDLPVGKYKFAVWARSSDNVQINLIAELSENSLKEEFRGKGDETWEKRNLGGGKYNNPETNDMKLGAEYKVYTLDFEITEDILQGDKAEVLFRVGLGGDYNPNAFKVDFEKITIWKTTGKNTEADIFTLDSAKTGGLVVDHAWDNAAATMEYDATEEAVKLDITKYNTEGGIWSIVAQAPLGSVAVEADKKYGIEVEMKAQSEIKPEIVIGRGKDGKDADPRFVKAETVVGNTYTKVRYDFETKDGLSGFTTNTPYIFFQLGKNVNDNYPAAETNVIYIKGIRFFEIDESNETNLFTLHAGGESVVITNQGDGSEGTVSVGSKEGATTVEIGTYNTSQGSWSIIASIPLKGLTLDTEKTYGYEIEIKADSAFDNAEMHCGTQSNTDSGDKWYSGDIGTVGTEYRTLHHTFKLGDACSEPALHLFLGKDPKNTATSNTVYIKSFRFFVVEGNEETSKIQDKFILFGDASPDKANPKYPISVYNQSDDTFDAAPMGTAYFENNKLVYLIHQGGSDWGHNKLAFGYWDNPIALPANAYYVVSFKIKASVAFDFSLTLHDMEMSWDEADGGIPIRYADYGGHTLLHAGTEETTIEVMSQDASLVAHDKCELLIEFGKLLGTNKEVKIEISDLKIGYREVKA